MAALDNAMISKILNALLPVGAAGVPGSMITALSGLAMRVRLCSTVGTGATAGTELANGNGYTTNGLAVPGQSTASSSGGNVTLPSGALTWTNSSGGWTIASCEIIDGANLRIWFGAFNGQPITVAAGNSFQIAANAITVSLT